LGFDWDTADFFCNFSILGNIFFRGGHVRRYRIGLSRGAFGLIVLREVTSGLWLWEKK
jgi:hypothetical protein